MACWGPKGCGYTGLEDEFFTGRGSPALKCPKCGKCHNFLSIPGDKDPEKYKRAVIRGIDALIRREATKK